MHSTGGTRPRTGERGVVSYDRATGTLVVGARSVHIDRNASDNDCLLRTYLELVAEQRGVAVDTAVHLRRTDVAVLSQILDLHDDALEARLQRMLRVSEREAAALARRMRRRHLAAALSIGVLTAVPAADALVGADGAAATPAATPAVTPVKLEPGPTPTTVTVTVPETAVPAPAPAPETTAVAVASEPAPAPPAPPELGPAPGPQPEVEIGHTVRYERDPDFVPPPGVDIGDAMVIERDAPPAAN